MTDSDSKRPVRLTQRAVRRAKDLLTTVQRRCRQRLLGPGDIDTAVRLYRQGREIARRLGVDPNQVYVAAHGGGVPNSYDYRAETTSVCVSARGIEVRRVWAPSRSWGVWASMELHVPAPDRMPGKSGPKFRGRHPVRRDGDFVY